MGNKNGVLISPNDAAENIIKYMLKNKNKNYANKAESITLRSIFVARQYIIDEEYNGEYHYIRKIIIISAFLRDLPLLFNNDYKKMGKFLNDNRMPAKILDNICLYNSNKVCPIIKYREKNIGDLIDLQKSEEYMKKCLYEIKNIMIDIILI